MHTQICWPFGGNWRRRTKETDNTDQTAIGSHFAEIDPIAYFPAIRSYPCPGEPKQAMMFIDPASEKDTLISKTLNKSAQVLD